MSVQSVVWQALKHISGQLNVQCTHKQINWYFWEMKELQVGQRMVKRLTKAEKTGTVTQLVEFKDELKPFSLHLFNANWQWRQYSNLSSNLLSSVMLLCMDFTKNYSIKTQNEAQGAHWSNTGNNPHDCSISPF